MVQSKAMMGMPISQTDLLETVNVKDIYNCVTQVALTKVLWMSKSFSDSLKGKDEKISEIRSVVITEEQTGTYFKELSKDICIQRMADLLKSLTMEQYIDATNASLIRNVASNIGKLFFGISRAEEDSPQWYPHPNEVLTSFCILLITDLFKVVRNPEWNPVVGGPNDICDIIGSVPISIPNFFMNNYHRFKEDA